MKNNVRFRAAALATLLALVLLVPMLASCSKDMADPDAFYVRPSEAASDMSYSGVTPSWKVEGESLIDEQKLIRTVSINAETKEFDRAQASIEQKVTECGGYIESQNVRGSAYALNSRRTLSMTARVPAEKLNDFTAGVTEGLNVIYLAQNAENVTEEYIDVDAKLETLKTERESLLEMMKSVNTTENYNFWYTLHERITELEKEIASYEARIRNIDSLVAYSTVELEITEVRELTETEELSFGERISDAFRGSWQDFADGWKNFAVWLVGAIPTLLVLAVVFGLIIFVIVRLCRRTSKKGKPTDRNP